MSDFVSCKVNGLEISEIYNKIKNFEVIEASDIKWFYRLPSLSKIKDILVGFDGTEKTIIELKNNGFVVFEGTI